MRNILIISNQNNTKKMIQSNATTRGELETELNAQGINTSEMSFFEGFSRTELTDANSQLPASVMYKGRETTDLIITLTPNSIKKVANGAVYSRTEALEIIESEALEDDVYDEYGVDYDDLSTAELNNYIEKNVDMDEYTKSQNDKCGCNCNPDELISALNEVKETLERLLHDVVEPTVMKARPLFDKYGNLNIDELAKEFNKD